MRRARATALALVNWKGVLYERSERDPPGGHTARSVGLELRGDRRGEVVACSRIRLNAFGDRDLRPDMNEAVTEVDLQLLKRLGPVELHIFAAFHPGRQAGVEPRVDIRRGDADGPWLGKVAVFARRPCLREDRGDGILEALGDGDDGRVLGVHAPPPCRPLLRERERDQADGGADHDEHERAPGPPPSQTGPGRLGDGCTAGGRGRRGRGRAVTLYGPPGCGPCECPSPPRKQPGADPDGQQLCARGLPPGHATRARRGNFRGHAATGIRRNCRVLRGWSNGVVGALIHRFLTVGFVRGEPSGP